LCWDDAHVGLVVHDVGFNNVNDLEGVWWVQVTLPFAAGWFDDCVVSVVTLFVELAVLCVFGVGLAPTFLEAV